MHPLDHELLTQKDAFYWYCRMDMATTVAAKSNGIITEAQAREIAIGIQSLIEWGNENWDNRPTDYLDVQKKLLEITGPIASRMHAGRSRQDMLATLHRLHIRDRLLILLGELLDIRKLILEKGAEFQAIVVPTYTNGVQAQPVLFGHLMCGYESPQARNTERFKEAILRLNQCPLGAAALATSRFNLDREHIAHLLGFDTFVDNAFDAAQLGIVDNGVECAQISSLIALTLNMFVQDIHAQFHHASPWILLTDGSLSSPSTLMPQKRNPVVLNRARLLGSEVVGASVTAAMAAHNVCSGLTDYKRMDAAHTLDLILKQFIEIKAILNGLKVDENAAMKELEAEFTTTSELAALLQEKSDIPLSISHAFASQLVDLCRTKGFTLTTVPFDMVIDLFQDVLSQKNAHPVSDFPFSLEEFHQAIHPMTMVHNYKSVGGSSPKEVSRMMNSAFERLNSDRKWLISLKNTISERAQRLDMEFDALLA